MTIEQLAQLNRNTIRRFLQLTGPAHCHAEAMALLAPQSVYEYFDPANAGTGFVSRPLTDWLADVYLGGNDLHYQKPVVFSGDDPDRYLVKTVISENGSQKHLILEMLLDRGQLVRLRETRNPCEALSGL